MQNTPVADEPFVRHGNRPVLTVDDLPFPADAVFNPGAVLVNGETVLLLRIADRQGLSHIRVARSRNGVDGWRIASRPLLEPDLPENPYEEWGCEDARVTLIGAEEWVIAYTAYSRYGPAVALALTRDFESVERLGVVLPPNNKDATVFPVRFESRWILLHRPVSAAQEHIWYACSDHDLKHWSNPGVLLAERGGPWWDGLRIGVGAPPLSIQAGWLLIYHGVKDMAGHPVYRLGVALLARDNPRKVVARASEWVFASKTEYEQRGLVANAVFTCGAIARENEVWMYYGAADTAIGLAVAKMPELLAFVHRHDFLRKVGREKGMIDNTD